MFRIANPYAQWVWIANPDQRQGMNIRGVGNDFKFYHWLTIEGSYGGRNGTIEYIKDSKGFINHRFLKN